MPLTYSLRRTADLVRKVQVAASNRPAALAPASWNAEERTVEVVWTTGALATQFDWDSWEMVDEELDTSPGAVRLDRLNAGAPVLDTHRRHELGNQIGVVVPGSARMEGGKGLATLKLSDREDLAPLVADIAAGIVRNLSVGYTVAQYDISRRDGERPLYRAVDWQPFEISFVPVPADAGAQVRSRSQPSTFHECLLRSLPLENSSMPAPLNPQDEQEQPSARLSSRMINRLRSNLQSAARSLNWNEGAADSLLLELLGEGLTEAEITAEFNRAAIEQARAGTSSITAGGRAIEATVHQLTGGARSYDNPEFLSAAITEALYCRMSGATPTDQARQFMGYTMTDMAAEMLERSGHRSVRGMRPEQILDLAAGGTGRSSRDWIGSHSRNMGPGLTTSDFPALLTEAGNRFLVDVFNAAGSPIKTLARPRTAADFRAISGLQLSGFGTLNELNEAGEIKHDSFKERKETYRLKTFAKMFTLTRQAIINDDLGAFSEPTRIMARAAAETEAQQLAGVINDNPQMADGVNLFHADHGNLAAAGAVPSEAALSAARLALRSQMDMDGVTPINPQPKYVLASPKYETEWEKLLSTPLQPTQTTEANPFAGKLVPLIDPRLTANPWYLFADATNSPVIEYAYLDGYENGPMIEMKDGWDRLGTSFRVVLDFGCGLVDHRGAYKNPGA